MSGATRRRTFSGRLRPVLGLVALALVSGCSPERTSNPESAALPAPRQKTDAKLAYSHDLTLGLPPDRLTAHFNAARDRCLSDAALRCLLVKSSIGDASRPSGRPQAQLEIHLPHDSVAPYLAFVTAPLPGESATDVVVREQATRAEDLSRTIADGGRRLAQLKDYRDRLTALSGKAESRVEDLVRIAQELAQVQSQIEEAESSQRGLDRWVETELLLLRFRSDVARAGAFAPVQEAWDQSSRILGESAAAALRFGIAALPWLPVLLLGLVLLRSVWRLLRRSRPGRTESGGGARP